jgi:hypothetical protein
LATASSVHTIRAGTFAHKLQQTLAHSSLLVGGRVVFLYSPDPQGPAFLPFTIKLAANCRVARIVSVASQAYYST